MEKFSVVVLPKSAASRVLGQLQPPLRMAFLKKLEELCESPISNSERASYFAALDGQLFRFKLEVEGIVHYCTVVFKFADSKDEATLLVSQIVVREV